MARIGAVRWRGMSVVFWLVVRACALAQPVGGGVAVTDDALPLRTAERRIVKTFDFDERKLGNLDTIPMHWAKYRSPGFPHFVRGRFDMEVGHDDAPSFVLDLQGQSVSYRYFASDIPAKPASDYMITAWVRTQGLQRARAYISAYFLDREGGLIADSEVVSDRVGGQVGRDDWQPVSMCLAGGRERARFIGIQVWLAQPEVWQGPPRHEWEVPRQDIHGQAWFDDITVYRLPRVKLSTPVPGNVFGPDESARLLVEVGDPDGQGLVSELVVRDAAGQVCLRQDVPVQIGRTPEPALVSMPDLSPGLYRAELSVHADRRSVVDRALGFVRLAALPDDWRGRTHEFGVAIEEPPTAVAGAAESILALTQALGVRRVKLPVWRPTMLPEAESTGSDPGFERLLRQLARQRMNVVGTFGEAPEALASLYSPAHRSLLDILTGSADRWRPYVVGVLARYADVISHWQVGQDGDRALFVDERLPEAVDRVRAEIDTLVTHPAMIAPWFAASRPRSTGSASLSMCMTIPSAVRPEQIPTQLQSFEGQGMSGVWVALWPLDADRYRRLPRLADFAKRVVFAHGAGVDSVFLPQPWRFTEASGMWTAEPTEVFVIYRTLVAALAGTRHAGELYFGSDVQCHVFDRGASATLVLWSDSAPPDGVTVPVSLARATDQVDLWGEVQPLVELGDGRYGVRVGREPVLVPNVESWLVQLQASVAIAPEIIPSRNEFHQAQLRFTNHSSQTIVGDLHLDTPPRWTVEPGQATFSLAPGQTFQQDLSVRFPYNETVGDKQCAARFVLDAERRYEFSTPIKLALALPGIDVRTIPQLVDNQLMVRQFVTNRNPETINFRTELIAGDRPPQRRSIAGLAPGQTVQRSYTFADGADLLGESLYVNMQEIQGRDVFNEIVPIR